jgi:hypothetical protein
VVRGVVKIGMHGQHAFQRDGEAGFFGEFPHRGLLDAFIPFHMAAGNAPAAVAPQP